MKKYAVTVDYVMTATLVVEARDEESAERKAWRRVHSRQGFDDYVRVAAPRNVLFGKKMWSGDGFDVPEVEEFGGELRDGYIEVHEGTNDEYPKVWHKQVCPKCGKDDVEEGGFVEIAGDIAWQEVTCSCGARYIEVYKYDRTEVPSKDWLDGCEEAS